MKSRSEKSDNKLNIKSKRIISSAEKSIQDVRDKIEVTESMNLNLDATSVPSTKIVLDIKDLCFGYNQDNKLIKMFNLQVIGPERLAIHGSNGSGKTTFVKLIISKLNPDSGSITVGVNNIAYLDQKVDFLNQNLTIKDNFVKANPELTDNDIYKVLANFNFRNEQALKLAKNLSGGERIRAGLAYLFASKQPPQLLILDEPTNHLDLSSVKCIENALNLYKGAIVVISHDQSFLSNIAVDKEVSLKENH